MKNFRILLKYVWPYRGRIIGGILAAVGVSLLYSVSIGMLMPILQVLTSNEGLTGWVNRSSVEHRAGVDFVPLDAPVREKPTTQPTGEPWVVRTAAEESPAYLVGVRKYDRLMRVDDQDVHDNEPLKTMTKLADLPTGAAVALTFLNNKDQAHTLRVTMAALPWYRQFIRDIVLLLPHGEGELDRKRDRLWSLFYILMVVLVLTVGRNILRYVNETLIEGTGIQATMDMRCDMYHKLTSLPMSYFGKNGVTDAISRVVQDTVQMRTGYVTLFGKSIQEPLKAVALVVGAILIEWQVVAAAAVGAPISYLVVRVFGKKMRKAAKKALVSSSRMMSILEETLFGLRVVKAYTMEGYERRRYFRAYRSLLKEELRMRRSDAAIGPLQEVIGFVGLTAAIMLAANFVLDGSLSFVKLVAQLGLLAAMSDSMRRMGNVNNRLQQADAAGERILKTLNTEPEPAGRGLTEAGPLRSELKFENIEFRYPDTEAPVLAGVSLTARAGQVVAVVGPNGSGKTTLLSLLPRFYDADAGRILWDGRDIREMSLRSLRQQIGLVTQDAVVFVDTVEANIRYGNKHISRDQVVAAARQAFADEFISQLPQGYDTVLGEHGTSLSGGQRQRLALARAILRNPSVLVLDEAMSQVDAESEAKIQQALTRFLVGRTAFVIAHRFSTVRSADQIVVLEAGRVAGIGRHEQLMTTCPLYRTLYATQLVEAPDKQ